MGVTLGLSVQEKFFLGCLTFENGADMFSKTSVTNYHSTLRKIPEERRSPLHSSGRMKADTVTSMAMMLKFEVKCDIYRLCPQVTSSPN
jgi:hypothetical protein